MTLHSYYAVNDYIPSPWRTLLEHFHHNNPKFTGPSHSCSLRTPASCKGPSVSGDGRAHLCMVLNVGVGGPPAGSSPFPAFSPVPSAGCHHVLPLSRCGPGSPAVGAGGEGRGGPSWTCALNPREFSGKQSFPLHFSLFPTPPAPPPVLPMGFP